MKKKINEFFVSLLLALQMMLSLAVVPAFADERTNFLLYTNETGKSGGYI